MAINFKDLIKQHEELSSEIDVLGFTLERILAKKYAIEQILDHHSMEAAGESADVDL